MTAAKVGHHRNLDFTNTFDYPAATGMERAAADSLEGAGDAALDGNQPFFGCTRNLWDCVEQIHRIWVLGVVEDIIDAATFNDLPKVHDEHFIGYLGDHPQVVGDEHDAGTEVLA